MKKSLLTLALLSSVTLSGEVYAEPLNDLLEQGTYQEEAVGDLQAALSIYQKVIQTHDADKYLVAQALYRQALCYQKLGQSSEAKESFQRIINEYAQQKDIVKLAEDALKKSSSTGPEFLPEPWQNGEVLLYNVKTPAGVSQGDMLMETQKISSEQKWKIKSYVAVPMHNAFQYTHTIADTDTFSPEESYTSNSQLGSYATNYSADNLKISNTDIEGKVTEDTLTNSQVIFDYDQLSHIVRRLPLTKNYRSTIPILYTLSSSVVEAEIKVEKEEKVTVPAGTFDTHKVGITFKNAKSQLPKHTFWVAQNAHRPIVKYENQGNEAELRETTSIDNIPTTISDEKVNIGMSIPEDWRKMEVPILDKNMSAFHLIFAPKMEATAMLFAKELDAGMHGINVYAAVQGDIHALKSFFKGYELRPGSLKDSLINGITARSYIADYEYSKQAMVEYRTYLLGPDGIYWFVFRSKTEDFDKHKASFESLVSSFTAPTANETNQTCQVKAGNNMLVNGDFIQRSEGWGTYFHGDVKKSSIELNKNEHAHIKIVDGGPQKWHVQLFQEKLCLVYGKRYRLSFDYGLLENSRETKFDVNIQRNGGNYQNYMPTKELEATDEKQTFSLEFLMSAETDSLARISFALGGVTSPSDKTAHQFYIDNIKLVEM